MTSNRGVAYVGPGKVELQSIEFPKLVDPRGRRCEHGVILKLVGTNICECDQQPAVVLNQLMDVKGASRRSRIIGGVRSSHTGPDITLRADRTMKTTHERVKDKKVPHTGRPECPAGVEGASACVLAGCGRLSFDALVFDVDGTLGETEETRRQAFNEAFCACGLDWSWSPELYGELLQVIGGKQRIETYIARLQLAAQERQRLIRLVPLIHRTKNRLYKQLVELGRVRPRAGVRRLMIEARNAGIQLAIASTTSPENFDALIAASFGPEAPRWFSAVITGDVVLRQKPFPDVYNLALARLGVPARRAIAFEDSAIGAQSAKAAGLFTVVTPSVWTTTEDFAVADLVLPSLGDPEEPLDPADERRIGTKYLDLQQLAAFHFEALRSDGRNVSTE